MNDTNVWLAWLGVLVPATLALWCIAAFAFRARPHARRMVSTAFPAVFTAAFLFIGYCNSRTPPPEPGWDIFYAIASLVAGFFTLLVTIPVVWFAEWLFARRGS